MSTNQAAQLLWTDDCGASHDEPVRIINVSLSGLGFVTSAPLRPGYEVSLRTARETLDCVVRYCQNVDDGRHAGVEVVARVSRDGGGSLARLARALRDI